MLSHFFRIITTWLFTLLSNIGVILTRLTLFLSRVHPFMYLLLYLIAIPSFASLFMVFAPHGFYAPYARYEPSAREDTGSLASCLKAVLYRSFNDRAGQDFVIGKWKLNPSSLSVDDIQSSDGKQLTFRVRISADGIDEYTGAKSYGWGIVVTVPERAPFKTYFSNRIETYRTPIVDLSKYAGSSKNETMRLIEVIFGLDKEKIVTLAPSLVLNDQEELIFQRYLRGIKGDATSVSGYKSRMYYLSAVVITTLGLGDIIPMTMQARLLVATEAVFGVVIAGLFLNALAYRASKLHNGA